MTTEECERQAEACRARADAPDDPIAKQILLESAGILDRLAKIPNRTRAKQSYFQPWDP